MRQIRSFLFSAWFPIWTTIAVLGFLPAAPFASPEGFRGLAAFWQRGVHRSLAALVGIRHRVEGLDNLPQGPVIFAAKHLSAWDTVVFNTIRRDTVIALKEELTRIPIFGWYLLKANNLSIDRGGAAKAMRSLIRGAKDATANGASLLIFPEGTRVPVGAPPAYKPGVAALYKELNIPVVPVALDSGKFWPRRGAKRPGTITLKLLEPIPPGMERKAFMALLEERIEGGMKGLLEN